jgi:Protein of unknown function (DUF2934)
MPWLGVVVDINTRRQKQQALITELLERKIRLHAQQRYDERGQAEGFALQDWFEAESEVLQKNVLAPLYRKSRGEARQPEFSSSEPQFAPIDSAPSETHS